MCIRDSDSKEWLDAGYVDANVKGQFNDDWNKAMGSQSKVFALDVYKRQYKSCLRQRT